MHDWRDDQWVGWSAVVCIGQTCKPGWTGRRALEGHEREPLSTPHHKHTAELLMPPKLTSAAVQQTPTAAFDRMQHVGCPGAGAMQQVKVLPLQVTTPIPRPESQS